MALQFRVGITPATAIEAERRPSRMRSMSAKIIRGESWRNYFRPVAAAPARPLATFEDLAAKAGRELGLGRSVGRLAVQLEHGNAIDPYNLEALEAKRRKAEPTMEYYNGTPSGYGMKELERARRAAGGRR